MYYQPMLIMKRDSDSSDPLNPTVNYTHFRPSVEQQDPRIPVGLTIYGIGCLVAFLVCLLLLAGYVIYKQLLCCRGRRSENSRSTYTEKPSFPNSDSPEGAVRSQVILTKPVPGMLASLQGEEKSIFYVINWDPTSASSSTDSISRPLAPLPDIHGPAPARVTHPAFPIAVKTMPRLPSYISTGKSSRSTNHIHEKMTSELTLPFETSGLTHNGKREFSDSQPARSGNPVFVPKGILKTSPSFVARESFMLSSSALSLPSDETPRPWGRVSS